MTTDTATVEAPTEPLGRRFSALLGSTTAANLADGVVQAAAPLYALTLTRSPGQIALLTAAAWLPWLVLGAGAGVLVDRTDRRRMQAIALGARVALLTVAAVLAATGSMSMTALVVLLLLYGVTDVLVDLAEAALVPDLVPRSRLAAANGRIIAAQQVAAAFVGAPLAGLLLALGAVWAFGAPALIAAVAALILLLALRGPYRPAPADPADPDPAATATATATATMLQHADASRAHDRRPSSTTSGPRAHRHPVPLLHGCLPPGPPPAHDDQSHGPHPARSQYPTDAPHQTAADGDTHALESRALRTALRVTARRSDGGPEHSCSHVRLIHQEPSSGPRRQHERPSRIRNGLSSTPPERLSASPPPPHGVTSRGSPHTATAPRPPSRSSTRQRRPRRARPCARTGSSAPATRRRRTP